MPEGRGFRRYLYGENGIDTYGDMATFQTRTEDALANLMKQRTIFNVWKKKRKKLYDVRANVAPLTSAKGLDYMRTGCPA